MKDYAFGKIYKIIDNTSPMFYVGSTCYPKLSQRLAKHRQHLREYEKGTRGYITAFEILNNDDYKIILLEDYPCDNIDQLHSQEQLWLDKLRCDDMINTHNAKGVNIEKRKQKKKEYYENHKEIIAQRHKVYNEKNKEKIAEKRKEYYETHKEIIIEKGKEYYKKKGNEKIQCDRCNAIITKDYFKKHRKTNSCLTALPRGIINELEE